MLTSPMTKMEEGQRATGIRATSSDGVNYLAQHHPLDK